MVCTTNTYPKLDQVIALCLWLPVTYQSVAEGFLKGVFYAIRCIGPVSAHTVNSFHSFEKDSFTQMTLQT